MAYRDLRDFIRALEEKGELRRIGVEVDPILEITEFADRSVKGGGPALLFEKPKGYRVPVLINAFASMRRMEIALQVASVEDVAARIVEFLGFDPAVVIPTRASSDLLVGNLPLDAKGNQTP